MEEEKQAPLRRVSDQFAHSGMGDRSIAADESQESWRAIVSLGFVAGIGMLLLGGLVFVLG